MMWKFLKIFCFFTKLSLAAGQWNLPLPSEAYSEGECISPQVTNVDINWLIQYRTFYVPVASQFAFHRYSETLLSRPSQSDKELNMMCLSVEVNQGGAALNLTNVGYDDKEFRQTCTPGAEPGKLNCFAVGSSSGVNPGKTRATENSIVAWDGRSYMILVRCVDGFFRDFMVLSTRPSVSHDVYSSVLNVTRNLGFDERRIQVMDYDHCVRSTGGGVKISDFKLKHATGPLSPTALTAPFSNVKTKVVEINQHNHQQQSVVHVEQPGLHHHNHYPNVQGQGPVAFQNNQQVPVQQGFDFGPTGPGPSGFPGSGFRFPGPFGGPSGFGGPQQFFQK